MLHFEADDGSRSAPSPVLGTFINIGIVISGFDTRHKVALPPRWTRSSIVNETIDAQFARVRQAGLERRPVGMDVGEQANAQGSSRF